MTKCSAIRMLRSRSIILRKNPYNCLYYCLSLAQKWEYRTKIFTLWATDLCYLYVWKLLCSALFEIVMDNSETPIVIYKKPEHKNQMLWEIQTPKVPSMSRVRKIILKGIKKILGTPLVSKN